MNDQVKAYIGSYSEEIIHLYDQLRMMVFACASCEVKEMLWAKLPSYYAGETFVRLIPFKDHINIEVKAIIAHQEELTGYKVTPKGMLQIYEKQSIPCEVLKKVFTETLAK